MDQWNKIFKPIVVLGCICVVVTTALAFTNQATAPIIAENARIAAEQARGEMIAGAEFTQVEVDVPNVTEAYTSDMGSIITAVSKGYGGTMVIMVAFTPEGEIMQVKVQSNAETAGLGTKIVTEEWFCEQFKTVSTAEMDTISGATISSKAVAAAIDSATAGLQAMS